MSEGTPIEVPIAEAPPSRSRIWVRAGVGALIGAAALVLSFRGVDAGLVWESLQKLDRGLVGLALLSVLLSWGAATLRWWLLFHPDSQRVSFVDLLGGILVGQTINLMIPARVGEIARSYLASRRRTVSTVRALATIVLEKVIDSALVAVAAVVFLVDAALPEWVRSSGFALLVSTAALVTGALAVVVWGGSFLLWFEEKTAHIHALARLHRAGHRALEGFNALRSMKIASLIWVMSAVILFFSVATNFILFRASGLPLSPAAALFVLIVLRIGQVPPSLPAKLGVFQYLVVLALSVYAVEKTAALTYSFALYGVVVIPTIVAGALFMQRYGTGIWRRKNG